MNGIGFSVERLESITVEAMKERGLAVGFSADAMEQVRAMKGPAPFGEARDLRHLLWLSIDNADTKDIDQLAFVERLENQETRLLVAIADVAESIPLDSPLDRQARQNTCTVYAPGQVQPMLPRELSTDWTSLNPDEDRRAVITEMKLDVKGEVISYSVYEAVVHNHAKLDYVSLALWHSGGARPTSLENAEIRAQAELQLNLGAVMSEAARRQGALAFETERIYPVIENERIVAIEEEEKNQANDTIAQMMIATNVANAKHLRESGFPVFQRALVAPRMWDQMREKAAEAAPWSELPEAPDSRALSDFLRKFAERKPESYPEVSLAMLKMMGGSDYLVTPPGEPLYGHFGQGVTGGDVGYLHSTAPNRRYPDLIVQRLLKAAVGGQPCPYTIEQLEALADHCNKQESAARAVQRQVTKSAVAHFLQTQIGKTYPAMVTGVKKKGVFIKVTEVPIEGKLVVNSEGLQVGQKVQVRLTKVDIERGYLDFERL